MKKRLAVTLCLLVFLCGLGNFAAAAADSDDLLGGDGTFENGQTNWKAISSNTGWDTYCFIETETENPDGTKTGDKALKIEAENAVTKPWVYRLCPNLVAGASYTVEGYIKGYFESAGFKTETYGDTGVSEGKETKYTGSTNNQWVKLTHTFIVPEGANRTKLYCRLYSAGTVYFDDVKMYMSELPAAFSYSAGEVFHYADDTVGTVTVSLHDYYSLGAYENTEIAFSVTEKNTGEIIDAQTVPFSSRTVTVTYDPTRLSCRTQGQTDPPEYTLQLTVCNKENGEVIDSYSQSLYRYNRPSMLGKDGFVRIEGKIIDPVIAYHVSDTADYSYMDDIGVTVVQVPYWYTSPGEAEKREALLKALDDKGLKALFCLYRNSKMPNHPDNYANTKYVVDALKNDTRVFAFALMDEPLGAGVTDEKLANLEESYKMIRDIDSMHPVYFVDYTSANFSYDIKYCDVFAVDPYNYSLTGVVNATKEAVRVAKGKKPVYTIVGAFQTTTGAFPSPELVRHMTYQALVHGAKGFGYFAFEDCISKKVSETGENIPLYETSLWEPMCKYAETDMAWAFRALVHNSTPIKVTDGIAEKSWTEDGYTYHFLMSMSEKAAIRTFATTAKEAEIVYGTERANVVLSDTGTVQKTVTVTIGSGEVMLIRTWEPFIDEKMEITCTENTVIVRFAEGKADLYVAVYWKNGELYKLVTAKNTAEALPVTVPEGEYKISAYAFLPGTLRPLARKSSL